MRTTGLVGAAIAVGVSFTLLPLAFGATATATKILHTPMLLLDRCLMHANVVMNNGHRILLFLFVNVTTWAALFGLVVILWLSIRHSHARHSHGDS